MFDRKTWIVLVICGILLAVNFHFMNRNAAQLAEQKRIEEVKKAAATPPTDNVITPTAELTSEPLLPPTEEEKITLENDEVVFTLSNLGGGISYADFKKQFKVGSTTDRVRANQFGRAAIGTLAGPGEVLENIIYTYRAEESIEGKKAVYIAQHPSGVIAKKTYQLVESNKPGAPFLIDFTVQLENSGAAPISAKPWSIFIGEAAPTYEKEIPQQTGYFWYEREKMHFEHSGSFKGGMFSSARPNQMVSSAEKIEYAGVMNQFFTTVLRPLDPKPGSLWAKSSQEVLHKNMPAVMSVNAGMSFPDLVLNPKQPQTFSYRIFIGPRHNDMLRKMEDHWGKGWGEVMQYGWFSVVSRFLNWLLNLYHNLIDGVATKWAWGLAIIFLTITVRFAIWPLHAKSTHTMKRMAKLQPEMAKLKEKYPDDPNKLNTEMMGLYRKYGINPLGGCLPMFLQIPIFFGFYRMLQYAVELRGEGFLWVHDLSQPDTLTYLFGIPINILPIVMAITSFLQIRMTPMTGDKMQQNIMRLMPLMFFFFCYNFASALALYWTTQNIFSIGQTWLMNKVPEPELKARPASDRKSWLQRMTEQQAQMQKAQKAKKQANPDTMRDVSPSSKKKPPRTGG
ncbi:MAG: membrane protein insertase YidC [Verrucomicrobia bacterium]|nr:MAG: membrane protein insertase YidC [Verrucomicrobiota bacterium]